MLDEPVGVAGEAFAKAEAGPIAQLFDRCLDIEMGVGIKNGDRAGANVELGLGEQVEHPLSHFTVTFLLASGHIEHALLEAFSRYLRREDAGLRDITDMYVLKEVVAALGFVEATRSMAWRSRDFR